MTNLTRRRFLTWAGGAITAVVGAKGLGRVAEASEALPQCGAPPQVCDVPDCPFCDAGVNQTHFWEEGWDVDRERVVRRLRVLYTNPQRPSGLRG